MAGAQLSDTLPPHLLGSWLGSPNPVHAQSWWTVNSFLKAPFWILKIPLIAKDGKKPPSSSLYCSPLVISHMAQTIYPEKPPWTLGVTGLCLFSWHRFCHAVFTGLSYLFLRGHASQDHILPRPSWWPPWDTASRSSCNVWEMEVGVGQIPQIGTNQPGWAWEHKCSEVYGTIQLPRITLDLFSSTSQVWKWLRL